MVESRAGTEEEDDAQLRLGRTFQMRVDIAVALSLVPSWIRRALSDRNSAKAQAARSEVVERIASALERRFTITWAGSDDASANAIAHDNPAPLFGGPAGTDASSASASDRDDRLTPMPQMMEHKEND